MCTGLRLNLVSVSSKCLDSYLQILDSVLTFVDNHKFVEKCRLYVSEDKTFIAINFKFNDSDDSLNKCCYVLSFIDSLYSRYHSICHMVSNFSSYSK